MKTFIFSYRTNYGLGVTIIKASTIEIAKEIAEKSNYVWEGYDITVIDDLPDIEGIHETFHS